MRIAGRALVRVSATLAAVPMVLLVAAPSSLAGESARVAQIQSETVPFGLLGPVGFVAIALGLVGMVAGAVRHRRRVRAAESEAESLANSEEPTRPMLTPVGTRR